MLGNSGVLRNNFSRVIKLSSWNLNGMRSVISKNKLQQYVSLHNPDILCMNQTRIDLAAYKKHGVEQIFPKPYHYLNQCKIKKGYSGVGVITHIKPLNTYHDFDHPALPKVPPEYSSEGRLITLEYEKFFIVNVYKPNGGDALVRLPYRSAYDQLFNLYINFLNKMKPSIVVGDFNVAPNPIDLTNPSANINRAGFTMTQRELFQKLLDLDMVDGFRELYPSKVEYTWWSNSHNSRQKNIGWRIDHIVVHKKLLSSIVDIQIRGDVYGSDHCPIQALIDLDKCIDN